jgi:hypothetical protein
MQLGERLQCLPSELTTANAGPASSGYGCLVYGLCRRLAYGLFSVAPVGTTVLGGLASNPLI